MSPPRPRAPRKTALTRAKVQVGNDWLNISISNVSATGLMVKVSGGPAGGCRTRNPPPRADSPGRGVWSTRTRFGLRSFSAIDVAASTAPSESHANQSPGDAARSLSLARRYLNPGQTGRSADARTEYRSRQSKEGPRRDRGAARAAGSRLPGSPHGFRRAQDRPLGRHVGRSQTQDAFFNAGRPRSARPGCG